MIKYKYENIEFKKFLLYNTKIVIWNTNEKTIL